MNLKELNEELGSYIEDAEKLIRLVEQFRASERALSIGETDLKSEFEKLRAVVDDEVVHV